MINFEPTEGDRKILDQVRTEALICRKYARYYDENEHEFPPDELEEAKGKPNVYAMFAGRGRKPCPEVASLFDERGCAPAVDADPAADRHDALESATTNHDQLPSRSCL